MNLHPLFVHFPIGLLVAYAIAEIASSGGWFRGPHWRHFRGTLVIAGAVLALIATQLGEVTQEYVLAQHPEKEALIGVHSQFGYTTAFLFSALGIGYALFFLEERYSKFFSRWAGLCLARLEKILQYPPLRIFLSVAGLITITITGGFGTAIVYGPDIDPFVRVIYHLFFLS